MPPENDQQATTQKADVGSSAVEGTTTHAPSDNSASATQPIIEKLKQRRAERRRATNAIDAALQGTSKVVETQQAPDNNPAIQKDSTTQSQDASNETKETEVQPKELARQPVVNKEPEDNQEDPNEKFTQAFTKLTRKEREIQERANQLKQKEQELQQMQELIEASKNDPEKFLEHIGWDYDKLTRHKLDQPQQTPEDLINPKLEQLEKKQQEFEARMQEEKEREASERLNNAIAGVKSDISNMIKNSKDEYELCNIYSSEAVDIVYNVMDNYYNEHKEILSYEDALKATENWLLEDRLKPAVQANKLKNLLNSKPEDSQSNGQPNPETGQQAPNLSTTMTNDFSATQPTGNERQLSRKERRELAKKTLVWND